MDEKRGTHKYSVTIEFETIGKFNPVDFGIFLSELKEEFDFAQDIFNLKVDSKVEELQ